MEKNFDPYHKWLGIPPKNQPANHYRLLAIEPFEDDPEVINLAADQRMSYVRSFQAGQNGEHSQKLLNELSQARVCLLDDEARNKYNKSLAPPSKPNAAPPKNSPTPLAVAAPQQLTTVSAVSPNIPSVSHGSSGRRKRKQQSGLLALGLVGLLLAGGVALAVMMATGQGGTADSDPNSQENKQVPSAPTPTRQVAVKPTPPSQGEQVEEGDDTTEPPPFFPEDEPEEVSPFEPVDDPSPPKSAVTTPDTTRPKLSDLITADDTPTEPTDDTPPVQIPNPFTKLPSQVELPSLTAKAESHDPTKPIALGPVTAGTDVKLELTLLGGDGVLPKTDKGAFHVQADKDIPHRWTILRTMFEPEESTEAIAQFAIKDEQLLFRWTSDAMLERNSNYLRNCTIILSTADDNGTLDLRKTGEVEAIPVRIGKGTSKHYIPTITWQPRPETLHLELRPEETFPEHTLNAISILTLDKQDTVLELDNAPLSIHLNAKPRIGKSLTVTLSPVMFPGTEREYPFSIAAFNKFLYATQSANAQLAAKNGSIRRKKGLERLAALRDEYRIREVQNANQAFLDELKTLNDGYLSLVDGKDVKKIHFRIYHTIDDREIDLVQSKGWK